MKNMRFKKLPLCLLTALAGSCLAPNVLAQVVNYNFSQGPGTQFTNGAYLTGTMTVDYSISGVTAITSANLSISAPSALSFTQANIDWFLGAFTSTICGTSRSYYEAKFINGSDTLFLDFEQSSTTTPIPGTTGVHTSLTYGGSNYKLNSTCTTYNTSTQASTVTAATQALKNHPASGAAQVIDANSNLLNLFSSLSGNQAISTAASQTLPLLMGGSIAATSSVYSNINRVIQARIDSNRGLSSGDDFAGDRKMWIKPFTSWANQGEMQGVTGFKARSSGFALGLDQVISPQTRLGLAVAYASSSVSASSVTAPQSSDINVVQLIGYGSHGLDENTDVSFQADLGQNRNKSSRNILFQGTTANSTYDSLGVHLGVGVGRSYKVSQRTSLTPSVRADYTWIQDAGYTESGAGLLNLTVGKRSTDQLILAFDQKVSHELTAQTTLIANAGIGYDVLNQQASITATYAGAPGSSFVTYGMEQSPWIGRLGMGLVHKSSQGVEITARYDAESRTSFLNQTASVKLRWMF